MATDFSKKMQISNPLHIGSKKENDLPLDIRTRLETLDEVAEIEYPYIGMLFYVKETDKYYSVKSLKSEELVPGIPATAIENYRVGEYEEFEADSSTEEDILISGVDGLGGLMEGQVIPAGTTFTEFLKMLLQKPEDFVYENPQLVVKPEPALEQEVGAKITPILNYEFTQNDAGEIDFVEFLPKNTNIQEEVIIQDNDNIEYSVIVNFVKGVQKYDDFGNPAGKPIPAGSIKASCQYTSFRYFFFGADAEERACMSSDEVRSLERTTRNRFQIAVPAGSKRITIAVPANGKQPVSVEYEQQGDAEYISNFAKSTLSVSGATPGENMMDYNVYTFMFLIPCGAAMTFNVVLG